MRRWLIACLFLHAAVAMDIYCEPDSCYDVLEVQETATKDEIKRAYRRLSLQWHPDKNRAENAVEKFRQIATAYEILRDPEQRATYDYVLAHPEERYRNQIRWMTYQYAPKTNPYYVVGGFIAFLTVCHYLYWTSSYYSVRERILKDPRVRKDILKRIRELEAAEGKRGKQRDVRKKSKRQLREEEERIFRDIDLDQHVSLTGWAKRLPKLPFDLLPFVFAVKVWNFFLGMKWFALHLYWSRLRGKPRLVDKEYWTAAVLRIPWERWEELPTKMRAEWTVRELWVRENFVEFRKDHLAQRKR